MFRIDADTREGLTQIVRVTLRRTVPIAEDKAALLAAAVVGAVLEYFEIDDVPQDLDVEAEFDGVTHLIRKDASVGVRGSTLVEEFTEPRRLLLTSQTVAGGSKDGPK